MTDMFLIEGKNVSESPAVELKAATYRMLVGLSMRPRISSTVKLKEAKDHQYKSSSTLTFRGLAPAQRARLLRVVTTLANLSTPHSQDLEKKKESLT